MKLRLIAIAAALLALAACGNDQTEGTNGQAAQPDDPVVESGTGGADLLARIDAETPYVYANLRRLPDDVVDRMWALNEAMSADNEDLWDQVSEEMSEDEDVPPLAEALVEELMSLRTRENWEAAGLHSNPLSALHAIGVYPVMHYELADAEAFRARLAAIEAKAEMPLPRREIDDGELIWVDLMPPFGIAVHHDERFATVAVVPDLPGVLERVTGSAAPENPLDPAVLRELNSTHGFVPHGSGYADLVALTGRILDTDDALTTPLRAALEAEEIAANPDCVAEFGAVARALPRTVMGYSRLDSAGIGVHMRQEFSEDFGSRVAAIADTGARLDRPLNGVANFGLAANLVAARDFARDLVADWLAEPPACPALAEINRQAPNWQEALNRPIPPVVTNLRGMFVDLTEFAMTPEGLPEGGGALAIFMNNPQLLVGMAQMFSPAMAELDLRPGGEPKAVPEDLVPQLDQLGLEAFLALGESALGLAVGADQVPHMQQLLEPGSSDDLLVAGRLDFAAIADLVDAAVEQMETEPENTAAMEMNRRNFRNFAEIYDRAAYRVGMDASGLDMQLDFELQEP